MKKIITALLAFLFVFCLAACEKVENIASELSQKLESSILSEIIPNESSLYSEFSENSSLYSELSNISGVDEKFYSINDFKQAYSAKGFEVSDTMYKDEMDAIFVKKTDLGDTTSYKIVVFDSEDEASKAQENENKDNSEAVVNGNALIIYEKGYANHDEYIQPFNDVVNNNE